MTLGPPLSPRGTAGRVSPGEAKGDYLATLRPVICPTSGRPSRGETQQAIWVYPCGAGHFGPAPLRPGIPIGLCRLGVAYGPKRNPPDLERGGGPGRTRAGPKRERAHRTRRAEPQSGPIGVLQLVRCVLEAGAIGPVTGSNQHTFPYPGALTRCGYTATNEGWGTNPPHPVPPQLCKVGVGGRGVSGGWVGMSPFSSQGELTTCQFTVHGLLPTSG